MQLSKPEVNILPASPGAAQPGHAHIAGFLAADSGLNSSGPVTGNSLVSSTTVSAATGISTTLGNITATGGSLIGQSTTIGGNITSNTGNIIATIGDIVAGGNVIATGNVSGVNVTGSGTVQGATVASTGGITAATTVAATGAITGASVTATGTTQGDTVNGTTSTQVNGVNLNPAPKNWLINGNMDVCQRYGSAGSAVVAATTTAKIEVVDRYRHLRDGTGATVTVSQQAFTIGQTAVPGEPTYFLRHNQTVAGSGGTLNYKQQRIEDVRTLAGQTVALSGALTADAARTVNVRFRQFFGTGGSPDVTTSNVIAASVTTSWQKFTGSLTLPSISGKTITADSALIVEWQLPLNVIQRIDFAQWQLEAGANVGAFQKKTFTEELQACSRYYQKSFRYSTAPATNNLDFTGIYEFSRVLAGAVVQTGGSYRFAVEMRGVPAITFYSCDAAANQVRDRSALATSTGTSSTITGPAGFNIRFTAPAAGAVGNFMQVHWSAEDTEV